MLTKSIVCQHRVPLHSRLPQLFLFLRLLKRYSKELVFWSLFIIDFIDVGVIDPFQLLKPRIVRNERKAKLTYSAFLKDRLTNKDLSRKNNISKHSSYRSYYIEVQLK